MIQPVIIEVNSQRESVRRLVHYIKELDGTEVKVIPLTPEDDVRFVPHYKNAEKACRASFALHFAALRMKGQPFIWLEHDSIPLKEGWVKDISDEYERLGKPFMLSSDSNPPYDLVGGIGVYAGNTSWMIPQQFKPETDPPRAIAWDLWMFKHLRPLIAFSPLIQHSYGVYGFDHMCRPHEFPMDSHILRKDAVIFHRDIHQSLMDPRKRSPNQIFYHSGDLGDIVYHLETIRRLGGGHLMLGSDLGLGPNLPSRCREAMTVARFENIKPLIEAQPYISSVERWERKPDKSWTNLNCFRETFHPTKRSPMCESLQRASLRRFGLLVQDETKPWLSASLCFPNKLEGWGRLVINRSPRYHNDKFPWKQILERYGPAQFIGTKDEHQAFARDFGAVEHITTSSLLEVANRIAYAKVFVGNQSCPYAIAEGLKKPCVQESWDEPNCLFQRPDVLNMTTDWERISEFIVRHL